MSMISDLLNVKNAEIKAMKAEIAALTAQLASFARGVKISIPTDTMEQEFQKHYRRGVASQAASLAALHQDKKDVLEALEVIMDWQVKNVDKWHNSAYDKAAKVVAAVAKEASS